MQYLNDQLVNLMAGEEFVLDLSGLKDLSLEDELEAFGMIDLTEHPDEMGEIDLTAYQKRSLLPAVQEISPFLTQQNMTDYGMYLHYLQINKHTEKTRSEYLIDIRRWQKELNGDLSIERINHVLRVLSPSRSVRMLYTLKSYARYRNLHGDRVLLILLSTSLNLYKPVYKKPQAERLEPQEAETYRSLARSLCLEGKREGIWIGLCLVGVPPHAVHQVKMLNFHTIEYVYRTGNIRKAVIENWLSKAMTTLTNWRLQRRAIHKGVSYYEVTPRLLNRVTSASHRDVDTD